MSRLSRRGVLAGGAVAVLGAGAACVGVHQGVLPGRVRLQEALGLNGDDGVVPDVRPGPVERGRFTSRARRGVEVEWRLLLPPGVAPAGLPVVAALHGLGWDVGSFEADGLGLPQFLAAAVADGVPPFAVVAADGGDGYWHERPDGEDAGAMVLDELLPLAADRGLRAGPDDRVGLLGWSMGGYGALRLAGLLGPDRAAVVAAASPGLWTDADDASRSGFADAEEYRAFSVLGRQDELDGVAVRLDCGTGDPFHRAVEEYAEGFADDADVVASFEPGAHDQGYWRRVLPAQLDLLGHRVRVGT